MAYVVALYSKSDIIVRPWLEAGYRAVLVDLQHPEGEHDEGRVTRIAYTKKTCLWTGGGFMMPEPDFPYGIQPDDRIHKAPPSDERANFRSATPMGFARAVFDANYMRAIAA